MTNWAKMQVRAIGASLCVAEFFCKVSAARANRAADGTLLPKDSATQGTVHLQFVCQQY